MSNQENKTKGTLPLLIATAVVAIVISFFNENMPWQEFGQEVNQILEGQSIEILMDDLVFLLGLVGVFGMIVFLFIMAYRKNRPSRKEGDPEDE